MKKIFFLILALGAMFSSMSCSTPYRSGYYTDALYNTGQTQRGYLPQYADTDIIYRSGNLTANGTRIIGSRSNPFGLEWYNMSVRFKGLLIYFYDSNNNLIASYDLRVPGQSVSDTFDVVGLTGKAISVSLYIKGGPGSTNYMIVTDGKNKEHYSLSY